ncbi:MAG: hypothetical protein IT373_20655 [Polyangiaceae bacterium]|nr:hypothetical protein [Polyangiaceae bacterium]
MSRIASFGVALSIAAALAATACGTKDDKPAGATGSGSAEAKPTADKAPAGASASGVASSAPGGAPAGDAKGLCLKMCDRAVECAPEIAKEAGKKMGVEVPAAAIEEAKKQAAAAVEECKKGCGEDATKATPSELESVAACLARPCSEYMDCMTKAAGMR